MRVTEVSGFLVIKRIVFYTFHPKATSLRMHSMRKRSVTKKFTMAKASTSFGGASWNYKIHPTHRRNTSLERFCIRRSFLFLFSPIFFLNFPSSLNSNFPKQCSHFEQLSRRANSKLSCSTPSLIIQYSAPFSSLRIVYLVYLINLSSIDSSSKFSFLALFFFSTKKGKLKKKYRKRKFARTFRLSKFQIVSQRGYLDTSLSQWQLLTIWKEREREITIPFFSFFWKDQSNPLALTNAPTAVSSFSIEDFNLFFLSPCPKKKVFEQV